ncbi:MAG: Gldg family protein [Clostridia bacterium]|nr:Gldg family protein [Clostridia bacterium]
MKMTKLTFWRNPRFRYGGMSTLLLCAALAMLVALNALFSVLEERNGWRIDLSFNRLTTYSDATAQVLAALDTPVEIYALFERGQEDLQLFELLDRYCAATPHATWRQTPLSLNPSMVTRFQSLSSDNEVSTNSLIVYCPATDRFRVLSSMNFIGLSVDTEAGGYAITSVTYENELTAAISYVTQETIPCVYFIQGHGEVDATTAAYLNTLLLDSHYDVRYATLSAITLTPEDLVVFLSPQYDLTTAELEKLAEFSGAGGSFLFACTPYDPLNGSSAQPGGMTNYRELLRLYGFIPLDGMVWAGAGSKGTYDGVYRYNLYAALNPAETTFDLMLGGVSRMLMSQARAFELSEASSNTLQVTPILYSPEDAYLLSIYASSIAQTEDAPTGPFPLGMEAYRFSETGEVSRAVMLGATALLTSEESHSSAYTREFIISIMDYLTGNTSDRLNIAPKVAARPRLSADALTMGSLLLVTLPLTILGAAFIILFPRRHL